MFNPAIRIIIKIFELISCIACIITKQLTDQFARRVFLTNQKFSREWSLLNNVTWSRQGSAFANIVYGGYTFIIGLLLLARLCNIRASPTIIEKIFLIFGVIFFFVMGGLVLASIEQIVPELINNAIILGTLSIIVAILFLIDLLGDSIQHSESHQTQTDSSSVTTIASQTHQNNHITTINDSNINQITDEIKHLNISNTNTNISKEFPQISSTSMHIQTIPVNGNYYTGEKVDVVQTKEYPIRQEPIFTKITCQQDEQSISNHKSKIKKKNGKYQNGNCSCKEAEKKRKNYLDKNDTNSTDENNLDNEILKPGFVARRAQLWDHRASSMYDVFDDKYAKFTEV